MTIDDELDCLYDSYLEELEAVQTGRNRNDNDGMDLPGTLCSCTDIYVILIQFRKFANDRAQ